MPFRVTASTIDRAWCNRGTRCASRVGSWRPACPYRAVGRSVVSGREFGPWATSVVRDMPPPPMDSGHTAIGTNVILVSPRIRVRPTASAPCRACVYRRVPVRVRIIRRRESHGPHRKSTRSKRVLVIWDLVVRSDPSHRVFNLPRLISGINRIMVRPSFPLHHPHDDSLPSSRAG